MSISSKLDQCHLQVKQNRWLRDFAVFNRIALAAGFLPSGLTKIMGERFTTLSVNHPMGHYLEALHQTGYYYSFIGYAQVVAAILLLVPRTATLGALLYFPIIVNICVLSLAVRFDGSLVSSPLMVLANLYLLSWDYDKLKFIFPLAHSQISSGSPNQQGFTTTFPTVFFVGVVTTVIILVALLTNGYTIKPRNTLSECEEQGKESSNPEACQNFCDCIHSQGKPLTNCLNEYNTAINQKRNVSEPDKLSYMRLKTQW